MTPQELDYIDTALRLCDAVLRLAQLEPPSRDDRMRMRDALEAVAKSRELLQNEIAATRVH
jgi:hypothetical protein